MRDPRIDKLAEMLVTYSMGVQKGDHVAMNLLNPVPAFAEAAIEQVFTAKNAASALKLGQARGVAVAACAAHRVPVSDYEPTLVKKSVVGTGRAEKEQVAFMVRRLLNVRGEGWALDTTDALAVAICHLTMRRLKLLARR